LNESGLREQYPCIVQRKPKKKKKHNKKVHVLIPGAHTQMDVNHQPHLLKQKCYVYNFVDHASNWSFKRAYKRVSPESTVDFMKELLRVCPFKIYRLQTDNGTEFTYKYISKFQDEPAEHPLTEICEKHRIIHKLIPPGEKELQGLVERSHRQDKQELFHRIKLERLEEFNGELSFFYTQRNKIRRFKKLGWKTPLESLDNFTIVTLSMCLLFKKEKNHSSSRKKGRKKKIDAKNLNNKEQVKVIKEVLTPRKKPKVA